MNEIVCYIKKKTFSYLKENKDENKKTKCAKMCHKK